MLKRIDSRGDTIIEVLIALAILGFALVTSYSILNSSLISARNAQEHSEALEYMNSQVELVRAASNQPALFTQPEGNFFCMAEDQIRQTANPANNPACLFGEDGIYVAKVARDEINVFGEDQHVFVFTIEWPGPGSTGPQKEEISYKIYEDSI